ncbi:GyrI-like domain-containing protein [Flavimarina sp. Hel_I_48]|uniref:GyrI-like domain-containing protein n=1 Tax=Flavimarina sp. Hel_I_48 TaxID=1392488 RepID=UPI0004DF387C|nr:GyrI-like domain-containing protein [Flavimarina sp. Hel_I_48]
MKKVIALFCTILVLALCWFLFIKKYDYQISFESPYGPGTAYQEVYNLQTLNGTDSVKTVKLKDWESFNEITQMAHLKAADSIELVWHFEPMYDSISNITVRTRSTTNKFSQRLSIINPFQENDYIQELKTDLIAFRKELYNLQSSYRIDLKEQTTTSPAATCACITSTTSLKGKAGAMIATIGSIEDYMIENGLKQDGFPMLQVKHWYVPEDIITFDFCFPIAGNHKPVSGNEVFIRKIAPKKAIYGSFHGNYKLSHRAWFDLYERAKNENIAITPEPLEVYHSNPRNGGDPLTWQADIYIPLKKQ